MDGDDVWGHMSCYVDDITDDVNLNNLELKVIGDTMHFFGPQLCVV
jgi:hypothetical protein